MTKKVLCFHHGLRGDLVINLPAAVWLHKHEPDWLIDLPINKQFADMAPLFFNHPALNSIVITDDYEHFPNARDLDMLRHRNYDMVGNPMQPHVEGWFKTMHQTALFLWDYFQQPLPREEQQIELTRWFEPLRIDEKVVAFAPFAGFASNPINDKRLSTERAQEIVDYIRSRGWNVLVLGGDDEPELKGVWHSSEWGHSYFDSVRLMLGCKALIHTDTGCGWVASGYKFPQLGIYAHRYYSAEHVGNIQPRNPNGIFLDTPTMADHTLDKVAKSIDNLLA